MNYYNDHDTNACAWLLELIKEGHLPPGDVDDRSILDIKADELKDYHQCHFFAGIGGWPYALQLAEWDGPCWTGSCPCQPLSCAGQGKGHADERHLWPAFYALIAECRPPTVFGEQVASKLGREWFAGVRADLEGAGYACGGANLPACSVGAPHKRERLFWVADATGGQRQQQHGPQRNSIQRSADNCAGSKTARRTPDGWICARCGQEIFSGCGCDHGEWQCGECGEWTYPFYYSTEEGCQHCGAGAENCELANPERKRGCGGDGKGKYAVHAITRSLEMWKRSKWLDCRDGKRRRIPTEPGIFPLAHGIPNRLGLLRGAGNAIVPQVAAEFVTAFLETGEA